MYEQRSLGGIKGVIKYFLLLQLIHKLDLNGEIWQIQ